MFFSKNILKKKSVLFNAFDGFFIWERFCFVLLWCFLRFLVEGLRKESQGCLVGGFREVKFLFCFKKVFFSVFRFLRFCTNVIPDAPCFLGV